MTIVALVRRAERGAVRVAASAAGSEVDFADSIAELLSAITLRPRRCTVVSWTAEHVDARLLGRVASEASAGALVLTAPMVTLDRVLSGERLGALETLSEPVDPDRLAALIRASGDVGEAVPLPSVDSAAAGALLGSSPVMLDVFRTIAKVASSDTTVLVRGGSGTGKEVVARTLHAESSRSEGPFVPVNCAAIPEHLLESELFGHEKGAFTGAIGSRRGRFERADGGTLFLDEIGDMNLLLQAKVLRALQERVIEPVGSDRERPVNVRVVAATHRDLQSRIASGDFREDLYFRLAGVEVDVPPLRDRGSDVEQLALHFAAEAAARHGRRVTSISESSLALVRAAPWPGNVRELRNVMDRAVLLTAGSTILPGALRLGRAAPKTSSVGDGEIDRGYPVNATLAQVEADHIRRVLGSVDGQLGKAAEILGIHRNTLAKKVKEELQEPAS